MTLSLYDKAAEAKLLENKQMAIVCAELNHLYTTGFRIKTKLITYRYGIMERA